MIEALIAAIIFLVGVIFTAGGIVYSTRKEIAQTKLDVNRVGSKVRDEGTSALRRHFNLCLMQIAAEDDKETRFRIAGQLKED